MDHPFIAEQRQTCYGCPDQWEGRLVDGRYFYLRYRHGWASLGVGATPDAAVGDRGEVGVNHGDGLQGIFDGDDDRAAVFAELLALRVGAVR